MDHPSSCFNGRRALALSLLLGVCTCTLALLAAVPTTPGSPPCPLPTAPPPTDNREGWLILFEEAPVHPLELLADRRELWVANIPDASVTVLDTADPLRPRAVAEIPVGLGPVTVRRRPAAPGGRREVWVVCQSSNSVFILDEATRRVVDSVRLVAEPGGLVFDAAGSTAYVTLSATRQIARVAAESRTVLGLVEFASEVAGPAGSRVLAHAPEPRALALDGTSLYALSYKSGNGTTVDALDRDGDGVTFEILNAWDEPGPPPPDRDVLRFDLTRPAAPGTAVLWRMGTLNFDLLPGADGGLWVSNVDLLNDHVPGKYAHSLNGGFANHRVSYAVPSAGAPQAKTVHVDLNAGRDPRLAGSSCSLPNAMALSADGSRLYVACYETRNTLVVDTREKRVVAELRADPTGEGYGPRGLALDEAAGVVYVYNRGDNTVQAFRVPAAPGTVALPAAPAVAAGLDVTPALIKAGRRHHIDARNSASGTISCNTCHTDGQTDGLAWDQRDFTGDLPGAPESREVDNFVRTTMDLRGIEATPPYHWRGDRADLGEFNPAFGVLLGGKPLPPQEIAELEAFVFALAYPPNPHQDERRILSPRALEGWGCFLSPAAAHSVSKDTRGFPSNGADPAGRISVTCRDCHAMAGGLATNNQIINEVRFPVPQDTTQLRGLFEKRHDTAFYAGAVRPAAGWGFGSNGFFPTVVDFVGMFPELSMPQKQVLDAFLAELDTGMAPATAYAWTLHPHGENAEGGPVAGYLIPQAKAGHADLIARGWLRERQIGLLYDPERGIFQANTSGLGPFTYEQLAAAVREGRGTLTFLGVPVGSGHRLGLDRDMDFLLDGDEAGRGTRTSAADSDGDGFPDGYEARLGADPADPRSRPQDGRAPVIRGLEVVWVNSTVAKIRWETDEETLSEVRVVPSGKGSGTWSGREDQPLKRHVRIVRGLKPGRAYDLHVTVEDLAANRAEARLALATEPPLFPSVHVASTALTRESTNPVTLKAEFMVVDDADRPVDGAIVHFKLVEWIPGRRTNTVNTFSTPPTRAGRASLVVPATLKAGSGGIAEVLVDRQFGKGVEDTVAHRLYFHPFDREFGYWARLRMD